MLTKANEIRTTNLMLLIIDKLDDDDAIMGLNLTAKTSMTPQ